MSERRDTQPWLERNAPLVGFLILMACFVLAPPLVLLASQQWAALLVGVGLGAGLMLLVKRGLVADNLRLQGKLAEAVKERDHLRAQVDILAESHDRHIAREEHAAFERRLVEE